MSSRQLLKAAEGNNVRTELNDKTPDAKTTFQHNTETFPTLTAAVLCYVSP